jgi:pimeloyl-ACP methyl ester carboxylesterase
VDVPCQGDELPWLCFLNGGPGSKAPRPPMPSWLRTALRTHRVVLLDQRGTGRSTPVSASTAADRSDEELAAYVPRCGRSPVPQLWETPKRPQNREVR